VCVCAATVSAVLTVVVLRLDRSNLGRLALVTPVAALVVMVGGAATVPAAAGTAPDGRIAILVYGQPDCGYCEELRTTVLPAIEREFGARIRVEHHSAMDLPAVRRTPTLVLSSGRS